MIPQDWSQEPWQVAVSTSGRPDTVRDAGNCTIILCPALGIPPATPGPANARRLVACVNACWGIATEDLENGPLLKAAKELHEACKLLLARCETALDLRVRITGLPGGKLAEEIAVARAAIAHAEGG